MVHPTLPTLRSQNVHGFSHQHPHGGVVSSKFVMSCVLAGQLDQYRLVLDQYGNQGHCNREPSKMHHLQLIIFSLNSDSQVRTILGNYGEKVTDEYYFWPRITTEPNEVQLG